jgi:hypothetical protein
VDQFQQKLASMQSNYAAAKAQQEQMFGGTSVDPGIYEGRLSKAELKLSKKGSLQIMRQHIITSVGNFEGIPVRDYMNLETEFGFVFARRWIEICGYTCPDNINALPEVLKEMSDGKIKVRFEVRRSNDFTNVAVMEKIEGENVEQVIEDSSEPLDGGDDEVLANLKAFAVSQDIEVLDDDDSDAVKEKISAFNYELEKLSSDEVALLNDNGLGELIQKPAPKPAPKPSAKAPVKKPIPKRK